MWKPEKLGERLGYVAFLSAFGTYLEYYDFFAGSIFAGTVWPLIFFAKGNIIAATIGSIGAYASTYFARPMGAYIFGHFGDKMGRRFNLILTLLLLAVGAVGIAVLPPYESIGIASIALLAIFRVVQGLGVGGEYGGGGAMLMEYVGSRRRGFWSGIFQSSAAFGLLTASGGVLLSSSLMGHTSFLDFGWRIVYGVAVIAAVIGMILRYRMVESPMFLSVLQQRGIAKWPASLVLKRYWRRVLVLALAWLYIVGVNQLVVVFGNEYLSNLGFPIPLITLGVVMQATVGVAATIFSGYVSDVIGRKITLIIGGVLGAVSLPPVLPHGSHQVTRHDPLGRGPNGRYYLVGTWDDNSLVLGELRYQREGLWSGTVLSAWGIHNRCDPSFGPTLCDRCWGRDNRVLALRKRSGSDHICGFHSVPLDPQGNEGK